MRSGWKLVRVAAAGLALVVGLRAQGAGAAEVKNVTAEYAWPWGAEIRYEVVGTLETNAPLVVTVTDRANNAMYRAVTSALSGDTGSNAGAHCLRWDLDKQGIKLQSTNVVFTVEYLPLYCVVDLSGGEYATSYPVNYMDAPPSGGFNTDTYKTMKLVLRRIPAGAFTMGSPSGESGRDGDESRHMVTLSKSFYIGLFEVTEKQWEQVTGSNPSDFSGNERPVAWVSWNAIRGNTNWPASSEVSANSFMGRLRTRTGLAFDLPTEAQWEYACRAGTTMAYSYGASANGDYMWYTSNNPWGQTYDVGTKKANPWGLYDMHGNVWEWCLDWYAWNMGTAAVTDPQGALSGSDRVARGGSGDSGAASCRSARRGYYNPSHAYSDIGFRLAWTLSAE
jgi:formylglycine-generating enzyme required for sulfatase activity